jgi:putative ABC transport system substrate-binding protein
VAVLVNPADVTTTESALKDAEAAARAMGLQVHVVNANTSREIDTAFETIARQGTNAVFVSSSPFFIGRRVQLVQLAALNRLPTTYSLRDFAEIGGLMSYGPHIGEAYRQIGVYAGRILKGTKPADLPVAQASKFELVINAQTARMLGLNIPEALFAIADEVIE